MYIEVAAHRGNVAEYPENTILAYKSAYEIGADMIELDLHMTKDGEIVLIHDGDRALSYQHQFHRLICMRVLYFQDNPQCFRDGQQLLYT